MQFQLIINYAGIVNGSSAVIISVLTCFLSFFIELSPFKLKAHY